MATGALRQWSAEKWSAFIQAQLPEQRAKLSVPSPALPSVAPGLTRYVEPR
jgi:hypothetical protein